MEAERGGVALGQLGILDGCVKGPTSNQPKLVGINYVLSN